MSEVFDDERFLDLLIQRSTAGLSESEQQEFDQLATTSKHLDEADRFDLTAAALNLSFADRETVSMPRDLQDRLLISAGEFFGHSSTPSRSEPVDRAGQLAASSKASVGSRSNFTWREAIALAATAACLTLLLSGFNPFGRAPGNIQQVGTRVAPSPAEKLAAFEKASPADLVNVVWTPVHDKDARGNVVWSDRLQEGYMVFENLDINDPSKEQYQLWIFDTDKSQSFPIDGGVFDINATGKVVVPIKAHVPVDKAVQFAVTVERPGGVTVSQRERIPVLASLSD